MPGTCAVSSGSNARVRFIALVCTSEIDSTPPPTVKICSNGLWSAAAAAGVVLIVSDVVTAAAPEIVAGAAGKHVGMSTAPDGLSVTAQLNATVPENPPVGVTVMVEMPFAPGDAMLTAVLLSVKLGTAVGDGVVTV